MSILVDDREDTGMVEQLSRFGLPLSVVRLEFGDLAIQSSEGLLIGYERKRLTDLIAAKGMQVFAVIDQSVAAREVGLRFKNGEILA